MLEDRDLFTDLFSTPSFLSAPGMLFSSDSGIALSRGSNSDVHIHAAPWKKVETGGERLNIGWLKISRICNYLWKVLRVSVLGTISEISIL